uniref:RING-type E3 ubiquitin transferase n=2 Tax=Myripristis murdjan TaxID=586833 RepID=A0A667XL54_9TELE
MAYQSGEDFPPSLTCLKNVDALLRCPICFDFLNISMMTKCSHNFCSLCIRKFLSYKLQCPVCNSQTTVQDLRNNRLLDDLVITFQAAREQLSKTNFDSPPISPKTPSSAVKVKTPKEKGPKGNSSILSHFFQKGSKTPSTKEAKQVGSTTQCVLTSKIQTVRTYSANRADLHSPTAQPPLTVKEEPADEGDLTIQNLMRVKQELLSPVPLPCKAESVTPSKDIKPVIKVECPVCSVGVSPNFINKHLDTCLTSGEKKDSLRSSGGSSGSSSGSSKRRPMGKLVYNLLSQQELKKKLKECHLSVQGTRDQMIKRHQEFVHIYNSQCDSLNPRSAEDIAKDVEANEKTRNELQGKAKPVMVFSKNQSEKEIDEMHSNYRKQHSSEFAHLIAQVQGRLKTTRQSRIKQEVSEEGVEAQAPHTADQVAESKSSSSPMVKETGGDAETSAGWTSRPRSPSLSDSEVSISSSISDIFGPEPARNFKDTKTPVRKRASVSGEEDEAASVSVGKRRRKT